MQPSRNSIARVLCGLILLQFQGMCILTAQSNTKVDSNFALNSSNPHHIAIVERAKSAEIKSFMNDMADPCADFYTFACGNYARINSNTSGLVERLKKSFYRKLLIILNDKGEDSHEEKQVKLFYQSCMRLELGSKYKAQLRQLISEFGTMPVLVGDAWQDSQFNWLETSARMSYRYGVMPIIGVVIENDVEEEANRAFIGNSELALKSRSNYVDERNENDRNDYRGDIQKVLEDFLNVESTLAKKTAQEILDLEVELAQGLPNSSITDQISTNVAEMHKNYAPTIDIKRLFYISLGENVTEPVKELNPEYQKNLVGVIKNTTSETLANYIFYQLVREFAEFPAKSDKQKQKACVDVTRKHFAKILNNMAFRHFSNRNEISKAIDLLWHQLKESFNQTLGSSQLLTWMEPATRKMALKKLAALTLHINSYTENNFTAMFGDLQLQGEDYVENLRQIHLLSMRQMREELHKPPKPLDDGQLLSFTPANILVDNALKVPVPLLQPYQLWSEEYPIAILCGTLAALIGREIMHSFFDMGKKYDHEGYEANWWDEKTNLNFLERQNCFTTQYENYIRLSESTSQSWNIADNGGVRLAYAAYRNWYKSLKANPQTAKRLLKDKLPNLGYTDNQLFFISYAQLWCNDVQRQPIEVAPNQDVPGKFRVIGPLSNFEEFATEFKCAAGTPMNPYNKCKIFI